MTPPCWTCWDASVPSGRSADMGDATEQAFSFAQDTSKQVLALATGAITITIALLGEIKKAAPAATYSLLHWAWILDGLAVLFGVLTLMTLTGQLGRSEAKADSIYALNVRIFYAAEFVMFVAGLGFTVAFGISAA